MPSLKEITRSARHRRIRKRLSSSSGCPRLCIFRSLKNIYLQAVDDEQGNTLFSFSTLDKEVRSKRAYGGNIPAALSLGEVAAEKLKQKGIVKVVFDRGGYLYHGRVKAIAEGLRKGGISF